MPDSLEQEHDHGQHQAWPSTRCDDLASDTDVDVPSAYDLSTFLEHLEQPSPEDLSDSKALADKLEAAFQKYVLRKPARAIQLTSYCVLQSRHARI